MNAGKSKHKVGTKIVIQNMTNKDDLHYNGLKGSLTHPFGCFPAHYVGVYLDNGNIVNLYESEFKILESED